MCGIVWLRLKVDNRDHRFGIEKTKNPVDEKYYILLWFTGISRLP